ELEGAPVTLAAASLPAEQPQAFQPQRGGRTIVIDAGHGGRDPGAIGVSGAREKDLVLAAAQRLKTQLEARGYTVFMTRDGDTFMELPNRVQFARAREADLFISLHADAAPGSNARGAAVYMLSERGQTRSRGLMHSQDWHIDVGDGGRGGGEVQNILIDLTQRETTNRSAEFANIVLNELETAGAPIMHRTPRNAGFFVLLAPDVPAVLVEMGFVTHAQDETRLADPVAQARMAGALADAVDAYFAAPRLMAAQD
ncbi:MAG: N-acetylmuramoyl-L-alanine amidase, partial [Hyphomonadaceae bacterium]